MDLKMTYHFKIFALALLLTGCSALTDRLSEEDPLLIPPDVIGNEQLICVTEYPKMCDGFLTDKPIDN
jgi:starvation-inducible outer membrane lipoprotein